MRRGGVRGIGRALAALVLVAVASGALVAEASADHGGAMVNPYKPLRPPPDMDTPPPGRRLSGREVAALADAVPLVRDERREHPGARRAVVLAEDGRWQVSYFVPTVAGGPFDREVIQVIVDDASGRVHEAWTGYQVSWLLARGYPGGLGGTASHLPIWLGFCLAFALPFLRRPLRLLHLDLAVVLAFSVSLAFFNHGRIGLSVAVTTALLVYLLVRMLLLARGRSRRGLRDDGAPLDLLFPVRILAAGVVVLAAVRVGVSLAQHGVIDVGYNSVIGADRFTHGLAPWGNFPREGPDAAPNGDTYGPLVYLSYIPFELLFPWSGTYDGLPAARAAAIGFDLVTIVLLYLVGRRLRGHALGVLLAYAWCACPFTLLVLTAASNDGLISITLLGALLVVSSPAGRGAWIGAGAMAKIAPLALLPVFANYADRVETRARLLAAARTAGGAAAAIGALLVPVVVLSDLPTLYERVVVFQADFESPFSVWGAYETFAGRQWIAEVAAVILALVVSIVPRRRDPVILAALGVAVLIALHLARTYWIYLYVIWWLPFLLVALLAPVMPREPADVVPDRDEGVARPWRRRQIAGAAG